MAGIKRFGVVFLIALGPWAVAASGCKGGAEAGASADVAIADDALVEEHDAGSVAWTVSADGSVKARVGDAEGKQIKKDVSGTLAWKSPAADAKAEVKSIALALDASTGLLVAAGPKLEADLTEVAYTLSVSGKPWSGTLHLPAGGTAELVASAKASAEASAALEGKLGPHGGTIQIIGDDRFEIVADGAGEVRVYLLGPDLKAIAIGERKITLAINAEANAPEVVVLLPAPGKLYVKGKLKANVDPVRITLAVNVDGKARVALVGFKPGARLAIGAKAPRIKLQVKGAFDAPDLDVNLDAKAKANANANLNVDAPDIKLAGPDVKVKAKIKAPEVKIKPPEVKVKTSSEAKAGGGVKASGGVKAKAGFGVSIR